MHICSYKNKRKGEQMVEIFKALSEESRLRILSLLLEGEMCVCEIETCLNLTQSNASRHLTLLKNCGVLDNYKKAQWTYYKINDNFIEENKELWSYLQRRLKELPTYRSDTKDLEKCKIQDLCGCRKNEIK